MTDQVIFDRGFRSYDGPRTGTWGARFAVYRDGIRRILGLRRKGRRKIFPWALMAIGILASAVFVGLHFAAGSIAEGIALGLPRYGELFDFYSGISLLYIAYAGPEMLSPDRSQGVLNVYFSRPLTVDGYLVAKAGAFVTVVGLIYLIPQVLLHVGLASLSNDGFLSYVGANLDVLWKVPVTALGYMAVHGAVVFLIASYVDRPGIAAVTFLAILTAGGALAGFLSQSSFAGARYLSLAALDHHPRLVRDELFGIDTQHFPAEIAGFEIWASVIVIVAMVLVAGLVVRARYRKLA